MLPTKHTADEAVEYVNSLKSYEQAKQEYDKKSQNINTYNNEIDSVIVDYIYDVTGLNKYSKEIADI